MNAHSKVTADHLKRRAIVYIRQSSPVQVANNLESQRRQYGLADQARQLGFQQVDIIDEDLGRSGSGQVERPGFARLVAEVWRLRAWLATAAIGITSSNCAAWCEPSLSTPMASMILACSMTVCC